MSGWGETVARLATPLITIVFLVWLSFRRPRSTGVQDGPPEEPYRVYTRDYDLELKAHQVTALLPGASLDGGSGHLAEAKAWAQAATDMEAVLAAQETAFNFDARLADLRTAVERLIRRISSSPC